MEYHGYVAFESIQKQTDVLTASDYRRLAQDPLFKDNISDEGADVNWIDAITRNPVIILIICLCVEELKRQTILLR